MLERIYVLGERARQKPEGSNYYNPANYWQGYANHEVFAADSRARLSQILGNLEYFAGGLCRPHPIKHYWKLSESLTAAKIFMLGVCQPAIILCTTYRVACALRKYMQEMPKSYGVYSYGIYNTKFMRIPDPLNPKLYQNPILISNCRENLASLCNTLSINS